MLSILDILTVWPPFGDDGGRAMCGQADADCRLRARITIGAGLEAKAASRAQLQVKSSIE